MASTFVLPLKARQGWRLRLGIALCASAALHVWLLAALPQSRRAQARLGSGPTVSTASADAHFAGHAGQGATGFALHLVPLPDPLPESIPIAEPRPLPGARQRASVTHDRPKPRAVPLQEQVATALPQTVDTTWYGPQDLDTYPRALAPIRLEQVLSDGQVHAHARLLLWLRIDEHGQVVEVRPGEPAAPAHLVEAARERLAAIRFTPARKDERAVKSRVLLSVSLAGESR